MCMFAWCYPARTKHLFFFMNEFKVQKGFEESFWLIQMTISFRVLRKHLRIESWSWGVVSWSINLGDSWNIEYMEETKNLWGFGHMKCKIISRMSRLTSSDGRSSMRKWFPGLGRLQFAVARYWDTGHPRKSNLLLIMLNLLLGTSLALTLDSNRRLETFKQKYILEKTQRKILSQFHSNQFWIFLSSHHLKSGYFLKGPKSSLAWENHHGVPAGPSLKPCDVSPGLTWSPLIFPIAVDGWEACPRWKKIVFPLRILGISWGLKTHLFLRFQGFH